MICAPIKEIEIDKIKKELEQNRKKLLDSIYSIDFGCLKKIKK
jgi:hypothetical protein